MSVPNCKSKMISLEFTPLSFSAAKARKYRAKAKGRKEGYRLAKLLTVFDKYLSEFDWIHGKMNVTAYEIFQYKKLLKDLETNKETSEKYILNAIVMEGLCEGSISIRGRNFKEFYDFGKKIQSALDRMGIKCDILDPKRPLNLKKLCEEMREPKLTGEEVVFLDGLRCEEALFRPIPLEDRSWHHKYEIKYVENPGEEVSI